MDPLRFGLAEGRYRLELSVPDTASISHEVSIEVADGFFDARP